MSFLDASIILLFIAYATYSGFSSKNKASENLEEYFLAGRTLKGWQAGLSMAATQFASDTPLLVTGLIATAGIFALWQLWIYALAFLLMGFVLAPLWRRSQVLTDAELTEIRYGDTQATILRGFKAIYFGTIFNCTVLAWVLFAAAKIAEPFLQWQYWLPEGLFSSLMNIVVAIGVPLSLETGPELWVRSTSNFISIFLIVLITFVYSTTGGLRAVVKTDIVQLFIMLSATAIYAVFVVDNAGGMSAITDQIYEKFSTGMNGITADQMLTFTPDWAKNASLPLLSVFLLQWLIQINSDGTGYLAQRSMACRSDKDAKIAALVFTFTQVLFRSLLWLPIALGLIVLFPMDGSMPLSELAARREATFVQGIDQFLPIGFKGIMITGMLAALASTVDTHLNWGSSYWTNDIFKRIICQVWLKKEPNSRTLVWVARGSNLLILLIALVIGTQLTSIQTAWQISLLLGSGVGIVLIMRWIWWRMTSTAEIFAIIASLFLAPWVYFNIDAQAVRLLIVAVGSTFAAISAMYLFGPESDETLIRFYKRVKPLGWWGPIAEKVGEDSAIDIRRQLYRRLAATFCCGFSIFCLLVGIGSWLVDSPAPQFFPNKSLWIALLLVVGVGLTPLWLRLGFRESKK